jgi:hypothetical protein
MLDGLHPRCRIAVASSLHCRFEATGFDMVRVVFIRLPDRGSRLGRMPYISHHTATLPRVVRPRIAVFGAMNAVFEGPDKKETNGFVFIGT